LPHELQRLIDQIDAEQIAYQDRDRDVTRLNDYLAQGDFSLAQFTAENMIKQQRQFRHLQTHGLPHELQRLIDQVNAEQIAYQDRDRDVARLDEYLAQGNFSLAQFTVENMIEQQGNIRTQIESAIDPDE
jgi:archaellum component FlaC